VYDVAVIGGGILGVATARELLLHDPSTKLVLLEKEPHIASHQSSHNSGVIHSGIYYKSGSLKAQLCIEGGRMLRAYSESKNIAYRDVGKLIVAVDPSELATLEELYRRGQDNGIKGLRLLNAGEIRDVEPHCAGIRAVHVPRTGIVDYAEVTRHLADDVRASRGEIFMSHAVTTIRQHSSEVVLRCRNGADVEANRVVVCAGLYADRIARLTGDDPEPRIVPFRGDYLVLRPEKCGLVRGCIYPVPDPRFPFLGVHFTPRISGEVWLGPNAVLAFAREGYRFSTLSPRDLMETLTYRGFITFAAKHLRTGIGEMYRDLAHNAYVNALRRYVPDLRVEDTMPGPSGVRAQAMRGDGSLVDDFVFSGNERVLHVRNAPSPAATASLAIARHIVNRKEVIHDSVYFRP
jgi:L-2-hydroxyglutarate oxidase